MKKLYNCLRDMSAHSNSYTTFYISDCLESVFDEECYLTFEWTLTSKWFPRKCAWCIKLSNCLSEHSYLSDGLENVSEEERSLFEWTLISKCLPGNSVWWEKFSNYLTEHSYHSDCQESLFDEESSITVRLTIISQWIPGKCVWWRKFFNSCEWTVR